MAEAVVEERQLLKAMRWYDGFVVALANPGFLIGSLGYSIGAPLPARSSAQVPPSWMWAGCWVPA